MTKGTGTTANAACCDPRLNIISRSIEEIKPNPANPRRHNRTQIRKLARILKRFGFRIPLLIDPNSVLIAGHARLEAARAIGMTEVPTITVDDLTEAEVQAFMIADNRIAELATWDDRMLAEQLLELSRIRPEFEIELTGFEMGEIDFRIEGLSAMAVDQPDPADTISAVEDSARERPAVTQSGDLWLLGQQKLLCGSALDPASFKFLLGEERASGVFTDPPYNVRIDGHASGLGKVRHSDFTMASGEMTEAEFIEFLTKTLRCLIDHTEPGAILYCCMDWRHVWECLAAARAAACELLNLCVWEKHNAGMGSFYRSAHELVLVLRRSGAQHVNNVQLGRFGRNRTNVWHYRGANDFGRGEGEGNLLAQHPTVKPVAMIADAMMDSTRRGDIVLDPFIGSGSSLIAAERVGRRCYGIEIDPHYVDVAIRRWQAWTREAARHAVSGLTFEEHVRRNERSSD